MLRLFAVFALAATYVAASSASYNVTMNFSQDICTNLCGADTWAVVQAGEAQPHDFRCYATGHIKFTPHTEPGHGGKVHGGTFEIIGWTGEVAGCDRPVASTSLRFHDEKEMCKYYHGSGGDLVRMEIDVSVVPL
eukprot:NODE_2667_length_523_cov_126.113636_g2617_i0.p1 GENE.NODE_2667_length_523_cov_126.113636_g2617_i0~~NODE_2667_length_523_cov_126.113636_g2617_i0.p1  ORF type:complete len:135 (+),score=25.91 NODE_2667_length_523_cov_126.113636_g2617_i0:63-467(+)